MKPWLRVYLLNTLFLTQLFSEVFVTYNPAIFGQFGRNYVLRGRCGNQVAILMNAYNYALQLNGTLVYEPIAIDIEEALKTKIKTISKSEFIKYEKFRVYKDRNSIVPSEDYIVKSPKNFSVCQLSSGVKKDFNSILRVALPEYRGLRSSEYDLSIGLHIRTGIGVDSPKASLQYYNHSTLRSHAKQPPFNTQCKNKNREYLDLCPVTRALPIQFYIDVINYLLQHQSLKEKKIAFYVFTDDPCPQKMMENIRLKTTPSVFLSSELRQTSNEDLEDILLMSETDGLVLPGGSTFSNIARFLGDHKYVITPVKPQWIRRCLVVESINIKSPEDTIRAKIRQVPTK